MKMQKKLMNTYKDIKSERLFVNRKYKTITKGSHKNGTVGIEYPY